MTGSNMTGYTATEIDIQIDSKISTVPPTVTLVKLSPTGANPVTLQGPASITASTNDLIVTYTAPVGTPLDASALYFVTITHSSNSSVDAPRVSRDQNDSETVESSGWSIDNAYKSRSKGGTTYTDQAQGYSALIAVRGTVNTSTNTAPAFTGTALTRSIAENTAADTNIGAAIPAATDVDGDSLTYTMGGTDADSFAFDATTRQIKTKDALDFETVSSYEVTITADDSNGGTATVDVTINVTDAADPPPAPASLTAEAGDGRVRLVWTAPTEDGGAAITGYQFRSAQGASVPTGTAWSPLSRDPANLSYIAGRGAHQRRGPCLRGAGGQQRRRWGGGHGVGDTGCRLQPALPRQQTVSLVRDNDGGGKPVSR